jgi:hypothetical protein
VRNFVVAVLLALFTLPLYAQDNLGDVGTVDVDGLNASAISMSLARAIGKESKRPFAEWPEKVALVFATEGNEFINVLYPPAAQAQVRVERISKDTRKGKKWSLTLWAGARRIRTEGCQWTGDMVVGLFLVNVQGGRGEEFKQWICAIRPANEEFYRVSKEQELWADMIPAPPPS